jgi:hypothetical protein
LTLNLHSGGHELTYDALREVKTPDATSSHVPIPHFRVVDLVRTTLGMYGHEVVEEHHAIDFDGMRYFGLLTLRSAYTGYTDTVGLRNANDRAFPVGIGFGSRVFVCSNLAFMADHVIKRRHTANLKRDLPGIVGELIEPLTVHREAQHRTLERYKNTILTPQLADHAIMALYRMGVINIQRIAEVNKEWCDPTFEELNESYSAWRLFNAVTFALNGRILENPRATPRLHQVIDGVCEEVGHA